MREEHCISFYSGYSGPQEHPEFLDANWIECLIGCRRCQIVCLENRPFKRRVEDDWELSDEETSLLPKGLTRAMLPDTIRAKLDAMGLIEFFGLDECPQMLSRRLANLTSRL